MIATCCQTKRLSRQVLRYRDSAGVRYVCAPGWGCRTTAKPRKTERRPWNAGAELPQEKNSPPLLSGGNAVQTNTPADEPAGGTQHGAPTPSGSDQSDPRGGANHHG